MRREERKERECYMSEGVRAVSGCKNRAVRDVEVKGEVNMELVELRKRRRYEEENGCLFEIWYRYGIRMLFLVSITRCPTLNNGVFGLLIWGKDLPTS